MNLKPNTEESNSMLFPYSVQWVLYYLVYTEQAERECLLARQLENVKDACCH